MEVKEQYSMPRCDIEELKSEIKHLKDMQANQDKEVERLRDLLKDCKSTIEIQTKFFAPEFYCCKNDWNGILTRINAAIGESEE